MDETGIAIAAVSWLAMIVLLIIYRKENQNKDEKN